MPLQEPKGDLGSSSCGESLMLAMGCGVTLHAAVMTVRLRALHLIGDEAAVQLEAFLAD